MDPGLLAVKLISLKASWPSELRWKVCIDKERGWLQVLI